jgi:hypothetical protein
MKTDGKKAAPEALRDQLDRASDLEMAKYRFFDRIRLAPDRHTGGVIPWTREELHKR